MRKKHKKKLSLEAAAKKLTTIAQNHLSALPEEEQNSRVASFARVGFVHSSETRPKIGK
jgi:hypothetical protein